MSDMPADYPQDDNGHAGRGLSVSQAAAHLGLSVNAVRHKIRRGTLPAVKVDGEWRVRVLEGMPPRPAARPRTGGAADTPADRPEDMPPAYPATAERQLEVIRDTLLRPLIEQNERQQERIAEQAETIGALQARLSALEAQHAESLTQTSSAPQTATDAATSGPWWMFWKR
jgi:excisionase family DNA binding protein